MHTVSEKAIPIGAGGFGAIYSVPGDDFIAMKVVKNNSEEHASLLESEYHMMNSVYTTRQAEPQVFQIPIPLAFSRYASRVSEMRANAEPGYPHVQRVQTTMFELEASNATYAMERIPSLPAELSQALLLQYSPSNKHDQITLCRLYLGKETPINRSRFFNSRNFPIDLAVYNWLQETVAQANLPTASTIATEMGRMLGTIHKAGFDCRDIEFVLAGCTARSKDRQELVAQLSSYASAPHTYRENIDSWAFYTFDFNQMRILSGNTTEDAQLLADAFFLNDPYFPRPRKASSLYEAFKQGYYRQLQHAEWAVETADLFFSKIESIQARKDECT